MKILQLTAAALLLGAQSLMAQAPTHEWASSFGNSGNNITQSMTTDMAGNTYATGSFAGIVDVDSSANTVNLDAANGGYFIIKRNAAGSLLWAKQSRAIHYLSYANGAIYATGRFSGTVDINPGADSTSVTSSGLNDFFVAKFDTAMATIDWHHVIGGTGDEFGYLIKNTPNGGVLIGGRFTAAMDINPGTATTTFTPAVAGTSNYFSLMLDNNGAFVWAQQYGRFLSISDLNFSDNGLYASFSLDGIDTLNGIALSSVGSADAVLAKLNPATGAAIWAKSFGEPADPEAYILPRANGNVTLAFSNDYLGTLDYDPSAAVANFAHLSTSEAGFVWVTFDANGGFVGVNGIGCGLNEYADLNGAAADYLGNVYLTGQYYGTVDFDPTTGTNNKTSTGTSNNAFVMSLDNAGAATFVEVSDSGYFSTNGLHLDNRGNIFVYGLALSPAAIDYDFTAGTDYFTSSTPGATQAFVFKMSQPTFIGVTENAVVAAAKLFPNPAAHVINIENAVVGSQLRVTDALGRVVLQARINNENSQIATDALSNGLYFFQIQQADSKASEMHKVIIAK